MTEEEIKVLIGGLKKVTGTIERSYEYNRLKRRVVELEDKVEKLYNILKQINDE